MKTNPCPTCKSPIPADAPGGYCPACILRDADDGLPAGRAAPSLEEVAAAFPQLEVLELIGQGGMGFVYKVRQPSLDRTVALKILSPELGRDPAFAERFAREARVLGKLSHPNIVAVFESGESGGFFFLLMEFVDGVNLRQAMRAGRFTPEQALAVVPGICDALAAAHAQGVWHRDIKPENILLDAQGGVKIVDFGIARIVGDPRRDFTLTLTGAALGSAAYMAPEQHERPHDVDHRADIYSLGVVIYEMLTGELPLGRFAAPSTKAAVDARIDEIVFRTLEKERELRQQSATEVKTEVQGAGASSGAHRGGQTEAPKPALRRTILLHAVLFALVAAFFFLVVPRFAELLREMGVPRNELPKMFFFKETLGVLLFPVLFGIDAGLCALVRRMGGRRGLRVWTALVSVVLVSTVVLGSFALYLPMRTVIKSFGATASAENPESTVDASRAAALEQHLALKSKFPGFSTPQGAVVAYQTALESRDTATVLTAIPGSVAARASRPDDYAKQLIDEHHEGKTVKEDEEILISVEPPEPSPSARIGSMDVPSQRRILGRDPAGSVIVMFKSRRLGKNPGFRSGNETCIQEGSEWRVIPGLEPSGGVTTWAVPLEDAPELGMPRVTPPPVAIAPAVPADAHKQVESEEPLELILKMNELANAGNAAEFKRYLPAKMDLASRPQLNGQNTVNSRITPPSDAEVARHLSAFAGVTVGVWDDLPNRTPARPGRIGPPQAFVASPLNREFMVAKGPAAALGATEKQYVVEHRRPDGSTAYRAVVFGWGNAGWAFSHAELLPYTAKARVEFRPAEGDPRLILSELASGHEVRQVFVNGMAMVGRFDLQGGWAGSPAQAVESVNHVLQSIGAGLKKAGTADALKILSPPTPPETPGFFQIPGIQRIHPRTDPEKEDEVESDPGTDR